MTAVLFVVGCTKEPVADNTEGLYLGVIGFNDQQYTKDISRLDNSTIQKYKDFINSLKAGKGTGLYYADYLALQKLKDYPAPKKLKNVVLVTFTDGLDNISLSDAYNPENYSSTSAYRDALHNKIVNEKIDGLNVSAYTIGLKGNDVTDNDAFMETLKKLSSSDDKVYQVANMNEAMQRFSDIAANLYSTSTTVSLGVDVPGGYDEGQLLRFTFDNASTAINSTKYIEATYHRTSGSRSLNNITYHGFAQGKTTIASSSSQGAYYHFLFDDLTYTDGTIISQTDINRIMLWKQTSTGGWDKETEFDPASSTNIVEDKSSALIMLVLDCTTSLGSDFAKMQQAAIKFVTTLANPNSSGNTSGDGDDPGGDDTTTTITPPEGAINGLFSVSSTQQVYFSKGNLQYKASTNTWRFAEKQYNYIGSANSHISSSYTGWIDLFGWGTSGWNSGAVCYQPWSISQTNSDYSPGGSPTNGLTGPYAEADWAWHNAISNGGNAAHLWRTLTTDEWRYLFTLRAGASSKYGTGNIDGAHGLIILPDSWVQPSGCMFNAGFASSSDDWTRNSYTLSQWAVMQAAGAVFLPAAGYRYGTNVYRVGSNIGYWSSTPNGGGCAYGMYLNSSNLNAAGYSYRDYGFSVRPVQDKN